jgi:hypothetical protein
MQRNSKGESCKQSIGNHISQGILNSEILLNVRGAALNRKLEISVMLDPELFYAAPWGELYRFFVAGNPPLALQLLIINTAILVFFVVRRLRRRTAVGSQSASVIQIFLIVANATLMFAPQLMPHSGTLLNRIPTYQLPQVY